MKYTLADFQKCLDNNKELFSLQPEFENFVEEICSKTRIDREINDGKKRERFNSEVMPQFDFTRLSAEKTKETIP